MNHPSNPTHYGKLYWAGVAAGAAIVAFGIDGLLTHLRTTRVLNVTGFFIGAGLGHDAVWAPLLVIGALATRYVPVSFRRPTRIALAASAALVLFTVPLFAAGDRHTRNPSVLPLAYGKNLGVALALIWLATGAGVALGRRRGARR